MKISTRGRYSLEALLYMALHNAPDVYLSIHRIAGDTSISEGYLEQLFIPLKKAGLLRGIRGAQGGYRLGAPPESISAGDILRAVEGSLEPVPCLRTRACTREAECLTRNTWERLFETLSAYLDSVSLQDLALAFHQME